MQSKTASIFQKLSVAYPNAGCELDYSSGFELLVAVILSAQCTDKRVNEVTKNLFKRAKTPQEFAKIDPNELEKLIFSCGFYKNKAKSIISAAGDIAEKFDGQIPTDIDKLTSLAGVGRKTANVIRSELFNENAVAVDTHVFRTAHRLGLSNSPTPTGVEKDLERLFVGESLKKLHHLLIFHGRYCCKSRNPDCGNCPLTNECIAKI